MSLPIPALHDTPGGKELRVHGQPFLIRGAELQNSSMSSARFMEPIWPKLAAANINTIFGCVAWETIEPAEGHFDFAELDLVIEGARAHDLRLILLWFGSFKNGNLAGGRSFMMSLIFLSCRPVHIRPGLGQDGHEALSSREAAQSGWETAGGRCPLHLRDRSKGI